jgi:large subunit ribosomal protein L4
MPELVVRNWRNQALRTLALDPRVFDYPLKEHLLYEAVCAYRAGGRRGTHKTKNRTEVSGGTRKLWRQKGTGRARMGDNRSPLWRHGGTVQGPVPRDYSWRLPRRMRLNAIRCALSQKLREGKLVCVDSFELETHKTQALDRAMATGLGVAERALLLPLEEEENLGRAARNNPRLKVVRALGVNVADLLAFDTVVISEPAVARLAEVLGR